MLTANKLEKIMELEDSLRQEYEAKLTKSENELAQARKENTDLQETIQRQLSTISELSEKATLNDRAEQLNRELSNRADKLQDELSQLKKRGKELQKSLAEERDKVKTLTQYDPVRMRKNLDASKKKIAEKNEANDRLQKALSKAKAEAAKEKQRVKELESKLEELQSLLGDDEATDAGEVQSENDVLTDTKEGVVADSEEGVVTDSEEKAA